MPTHLSLSIGEYSDKGRKAENQDFCGVMLPSEPQLSTKGIVVAIADGISSSEVSHIASEASVRSLLEDYYCTSETWSVKKSALQVLSANNSWLHSQTRKSEYRYNHNKGYVCTISALIIKFNTAYIFHVGDSRIYHFRNGKPTLLTNDHRKWVSSEKSYLSRAMGVNPNLDLEHISIQVEKEDIFVLATDGVYEHVNEQQMFSCIQNDIDNLHQAAKKIVSLAYDDGSLDNLSVQVVKVDDLPSVDNTPGISLLSELAFPPVLQVRSTCDGFKILRVLYSSSRSHVYLAENSNACSKQAIVIKAPSIELKDDPAHLERFLMEEWIAKRITSAHVLKPVNIDRKREYLFTAFEYIEGQTLHQWMIDNPRPSLHSVREIIEQIAKGLQAFHRLEMLHQDIRPDNVMIDKTGVVKIIDFGSTKVAGVTEMTKAIEHHPILGTVQYTAPEYFLGEAGTERSDLFSLAVITYQMLTGKLPYGTKVAASRTKSAQSKLRYQTALHDDREIPAWVDFTLQKALHTNPYKRYQAISEFVFNLSHPSKEFLSRNKPPLVDRNPVMFWQGVSAILVLVILTLLAR